VPGGYERIPLRATGDRFRSSDGPRRPRSGPFYPPREDTGLLVGAAAGCRDLTVLEIGTGSGTVAAAAARAGARYVVATDRNPFALREARRRAREDRLSVEAVRTDLGRGLALRFDRVLSNPPYLPTRPADRDTDRWQNLAMDGGPDGCRFLARLLRSLPALLAPTGRAYVVVSSRQHRTRLGELRRGWRSRGGRVRVVAVRQLEGERLDLWELRCEPLRRDARRTVRRGPGTPRRPTARPASRSGSSRVAGRGRTPAPGGA
jgi:release factor glutamine methyltransferase